MWETAVDWNFVRYLQQRLHRPGRLDRRYAEQLIARHMSMGTSLNLAGKLNRRWQPLDEEQTLPVPIVYATPAAMSPTHFVEKSLDGDGATNKVIQRQLIVEKHTVHRANLGSQQPELNMQTQISDAGQGVNSLPKHEKIGPQTSRKEVMGTAKTAVPTANTSTTAALPLAATQQPATALPLVTAQSPASAAQSATVQVQNQTLPAEERTAVLPLPVVLPVQPPPAEQGGQLPPATLPISAIQLITSVADPNQSAAPPGLLLVTPEPVMNIPMPIWSSRQAELPLVEKQKVVKETAVTVPQAAPIPNDSAKPPGWMQGQAQNQNAPPSTLPINIDNLVDKVEQQLHHRLTIQRERRGKG